MGLGDDLKKEVAEVFRSTWTERDGQVVPEPESLKLTNDAIKLTGTVLYADMAESTHLVDKYKAHFAAEVYKTYLHCAAKIIRSEAGEITAYDGDRIMAVFVGEGMNTRAARAGLKINYARLQIVNPAIKAQYQAETYQMAQTVGIDTSPLYVARTGIRGSNDLVWVGRAANYAAKLSALGGGYSTYITAAVYKKIADVAKYTDGKSMWEEASWDGNAVYRSTWQWRV
jgi:class 3 adenylate cyclase